MSETSKERIQMKVVITGKNTDINRSFVQKLAEKNFKISTKQLNSLTYSNIRREINFSGSNREEISTKIIEYPYEKIQTPVYKMFLRNTQATIAICESKNDNSIEIAIEALSHVVQSSEISTKGTLLVVEEESKNSEKNQNQKNKIFERLKQRSLDKNVEIEYLETPYQQKHAQKVLDNLLIGYLDTLDSQSLRNDVNTPKYGQQMINDGRIKKQLPKKSKNQKKCCFCQLPSPSFRSPFTPHQEQTTPPQTSSYLQSTFIIPKQSINLPLPSHYPLQKITPKPQLKPPSQKKLHSNQRRTTHQTTQPHLLLLSSPFKPRNLTKAMKTEEYEVQNLISEAYYYATHISENESYIDYSRRALDRADNIMKPQIHKVFLSFGLQTLISIPETAMKVPGRLPLANTYLDLFFKLVKNEGQFYIRALILKATLQSLESERLGLKASQNLENTQKAFSFARQAIQLIAKNSTNKKKYSFLIYNVSLCVYNILRPFFRTGWLKPFLEIVEEVNKLLEEVQEPDVNWKTRFAWVFFNCMQDSDPNKALPIFNALWQKAKASGGVEFEENLLRHRIHFSKNNPGALKAIAKEVEDLDQKSKEPGLVHLFKLQCMKSHIIEKNQIDKDMHSLIQSINPAITTNQESISNTKLTSVLQERLAEAARVAINYRNINNCKQILSFLRRIRQTTQKTYVWMEYSKAQLLITESGNNIDPKTGIRLNMEQIRKQEIERRVEALKILEKTMGTNKNLNDADLIYEGCVLIWNIGLPFINESFKNYIYEPFLSACELLEEIQSTNHKLRVNFHLQLAKIDLQQSFKKKAYSHIQRAMKLDYSIPEEDLQFPQAEGQDKKAPASKGGRGAGKAGSKEESKAQVPSGEDISLYQRVLDRYLLYMKQKVGKEESGQENELSDVVAMIESAQSAKLESVKQQKLHQALRKLVNLPTLQYKEDPSKDLVPEEIKRERHAYNLRQREMYKRSKLLAGEIVKLAFDWKFSSFVFRAAEFITKDEWEHAQVHKEMIANQVEVYHILAQTKIEELLEVNVEPAFEEFLLIDEQRTSLEDYSDEDKIRLKRKKKDIIAHHIKSLELASKVGQNWMVFNGAIYIWNNYLMTFKNPLNDTKLMPDITDLLRAYFETMKESIKDIEQRRITDYDLDSKIQVYGNMGIIYARLLEGASRNEEVRKVCETLLLAPLSPHTRKLVNSIKARVTSGGKGGAGGAKGKDSKAGGGQLNQNDNDKILFDVVSKLEIIQNNTNKSQTPKLIEDCFGALNVWKVRENDETDLELHAELWTRLSKLALNDKNTMMYKYSLSCVENTLSMLEADVDMSSIPTNRLRWYSLAEYLYAETLCKMVNQETQEKDSQETIYFHALKHSLEACHKGSKARNHQLVIDAAKQFWDITSVLKSSYVNRRVLMKPIFSTIHYLNIIKQDIYNEPNLVILLQNVLFQGCMENQEWSLGETAADMALELVPSNFKKQIWSWKMVFMSKQGKDELSIMNNIKDCDPFLQAKVWLKMARTSSKVTKQYTAFNNAIEVLKKEQSVAIVTVLIEFSEWLLRNKYEAVLVRDNLLMAADILLEVELADAPEGGDDDEEDDEGDLDEENGELRPPTIFSRSSRGKKSSMLRSEQSRSRQGSRATREQLNVGLDSNKISRLQKSTGSQQSRMNRASKRDVKTINTDHQKLIVTQNDDEDPFADKLNIKHFDQLFRIHAMLAVLANTAEQKIQYSFDALFFIKKIIEKTFSNLEDLIQTSEKLGNKEEDGHDDDEQVAGSGFQLPESVEGWIPFKFPKELIDRIQTNSESNIFCKFAFEYPELTFLYLERIVENFEGYGLHTQNVLLLNFSRLFSENLLCNRYLSTATNFKYARCLFSLGYPTPADLLLQESLEECKFEEKAFKNQRQDLERMMASGSDTTVVSQGGGRQPKVRAEYLPYEGWMRIAKELVNFGDFVTARKLLEEARGHCVYLSKQQEIGDIMLTLADVYYQEGKYEDALRASMEAHGLIKDLGKWCQSAKLTFAILERMDRWEDIGSFLQKMMVTLMDCRKNGQEFESIGLELGQTWSQISLLRGHYFLHRLEVQKDGEDFLSLISKALKAFISSAATHGCLWRQISLVVAFGQKVELLVRSTRVLDKDSFKKQYKLLRVVTGLLEKVSSLTNLNLRYLFVNNLKQEGIRAPLFKDVNRLKLEISKLHILIGLLKLKSQKMGISVAQLDQVEMDGSGIEDPSLTAEEDFERQTRNLPERHVKYLLKLTKQVEALNQGSKKRLDHFERAAALAQEVNDYQNNCGGDPYESEIQILRALRYKRKKEGRVEGVWSRSNSDSRSVDTEGEDFDDEEDEEVRSQIALKLEVLIQQQQLQQSKNDQNCYCLSPIFNTRSFTNRKEIGYESMQLYGDSQERALQFTFSALADYQSATASEYLWSKLEDLSRSDYKPLLLSRLAYLQREGMDYKNERLVSEISKNFRVMDQFLGQKGVDDLIKNLKPRTAIVIFQLNRIADELYIGFMGLPETSEEENGKRAGGAKKKGAKQPLEVEEEDEEEGGPEYMVKRVALKKEQVDLLDEYLHLQNEVNSVMFKTPFLLKEDMKQLEGDSNHILEKKFKEFNTLIGDLCGDVADLLNIGKHSTSQNGDGEADEPQSQIASPKAGGKSSRKPQKNDKSAAKKLDPKNLGNGQEGQTSSSPGGYSYLTILVDHSYINLPFEMTDCFKQVPIISKDYSVNLLSTRFDTLSPVEPSEDPSIKERGDPEEVCSLQNLKYVAYDFKTVKINEEGQEGVDAESTQKIEAYNTEAARLELSRNLGSGISGYSSSKGIPSLGDWMECLSSSSSFLYYGNLPLINMIASHTLVDLANETTLKMAIVFDRINPLKKIINKVNPIENDIDQTPILELPQKTTDILAILGVGVQIQNLRNVDPSSNIEVLRRLIVDKGGEENAMIPEIRQFLEAKVERKFNLNGCIVEDSPRPELETDEEGSQSKGNKGKNGTRGKPKNSKEKVVQDSKKLQRGKDGESQDESSRKSEDYEVREVERMFIQKSNISIIGVPYCTIQRQIGIRNVSQIQDGQVVKIIRERDILLIKQIV